MAAWQDVILLVFGQGWRLRLPFFQKLEIAGTEICENWYFGGISPRLDATITFVMNYLQAFLRSAPMAVPLLVTTVNIANKRAFRSILGNLKDQSVRRRGS